MNRAGQLTFEEEPEHQQNADGPSEIVTGKEKRRFVVAADRRHGADEGVNPQLGIDQTTPTSVGSMVRNGRPD
tara:strand:+ start:867 stop:1085 length:219 start_codon:yes stop_codon:yes gene_type:complete